jgi:hypothetical protein
LATAVCGAVLITGVFRGEKPKAPESWTMVPSEVRFWFPTGIVVVERKPNTPEFWRVLRAEDRIWFARCSDRPEHTFKPTSIFSEQVTDHPSISRVAPDVKVQAANALEAVQRLAERKLEAK